MRTQEESIKRIGDVISGGYLSTGSLDRLVTLVDGLRDDRSVDYANAWLTIVSRNLDEEKRRIKA
jgi:hypothetical protein